MRVDAKKILFLGYKEHESAFFSACQRAGLVEFISKDSKKAGKAPKEVTDVLKVVKLLHRVQVSGTHESQLTPKEIASQALAFQNKLEKLEEEERYLNLESARVSPFGDFSIDDIHWIQDASQRFLQFFISKNQDMHDEYVQKYPDILSVSRENKLDYFLSVSTSKQSYPGLIEVMIDKPLGKLLDRADIIAEKKKEIKSELVVLAGYRQLIDDYYVHLLDKHNLDTAQNLTEGLTAGNVFSIEAWAPCSREAELEEVTKRYAVYYEEVKVEKNDVMPTCFENKGSSRIGQDIIGIYDTPSNTDKDPSKWVLWAFAIFFAMIVGDAGYGTVFLIITLLLKWKLPNLQGVGKRMLRLFGTLSVACILWGILTTSFFGVNIGINNPVRDLSLTQWLAEKKTEYHFDKKDDVYQYWVKKYPSLKGQTNPEKILKEVKEEKDGSISYPLLDKFVGNLMLEFSIFFGTIHVILGMLRYLFRAWSGLGWIIFMIGSYLFFPSVLEATSILNFLFGVPKVAGAALGLNLIYAGIGLAMVFAIIKDKLAGLNEIANLIQIFADVLSYLRLYALGLAGGIMSVTFNEMGLSAGVYVGWMIILAGHIVNISLSVMGGVIHGLRLNFLEWYHYSFEGGGQNFKPLSLHKVPKN